LKSCEYYIEKISLLIDGELSQEDRDELRAHFAVCSECAAVYKAFSAVSSSLGNSLEEPPEQLRGAIMGEVMRLDRAKKKKQITKLASYAACLGVVVFAGYKIMNLEPADVSADVETQPVAKSAVSTSVPEVSEQLDTAEAENTAGVAVDGNRYSSSAGINADKAIIASATNEMFTIVNPQTLSWLDTLLTPVEGSNSAPQDFIDYFASFYCGDTCIAVDIYVEDYGVFADFGEGPVPVAGTPADFTDLFG